MKSRTDKTSFFKVTQQEKNLARGLGWMSVGLGTIALLMPKKLAKAIGVAPHNRLLRTIAVRELVSGAAILSCDEPKAAVRSRVLGDIFDLSLLTSALCYGSTNRKRTLFAAAALAGIASLDHFSSGQLRQMHTRWKNGRLRIRRTISIQKSPEELYAFWRSFENLPYVMRHLKSVEELDETTSRWIANAPAGMTVQWDAEIIADEPNRKISWRSIEGSEIVNSGSVRFMPQLGKRGTILYLEFEYTPPAGALGAGIARIFGEEPDGQIHDDLLLFKQAIETGEFATTRGQPAGPSLMRTIIRPNRFQPRPRNTSIN